MSYDVLISNLRAAADKYDAVAVSLGADGVDLADVEPDTFGHIELTAWVKAVADQCDQATKALHDGAVDLGTNLRTTAYTYETTDQGVESWFSTPFGGPTIGPTP